MTESRGGFRPHAGMFCALAAVAANPGCSCSDAASEQPRTPDSSTAATTGAGGTDSAGGAAPYAVTTLTTALAFDATPDPQAGYVYFTGLDANGSPGVFRISARGGEGLAPLAVGPPFVAPLGIATSTDGGHLYVADPGAGDASGGDAGQIFQVNVTSGVSRPVAGGEAMLARGLEVVHDEAGADLLVFSGADKVDGRPGVFQLPARGGQVSVLAKGSPLVDPSGVAISEDGRVFVCDTLSNPDKTATLFKIEDGFVAPFFTGLRAGYPCGLALARGGQTLFAATRDTETGRVEVVGIDVASAAVVLRIAVVHGQDEPGGLHRAKGADAFAFVEGSDKDTAAVSLIKR